MDTKDWKAAWDYVEAIPGFAREKSAIPKVREFLGLLGNPDRDFQIFHVAGTNGKGSVCAFLSSMLAEAGISHGTFVSPHLVDIRERFLVNGRMASEEEFLTAFQGVKTAVDAWTSMGNPHPTYFEFLFYMGLLLFQRAGVRVLVLETGMGGRNDVTNVVEAPLVSIITSISIEHTAYLGGTIPEIAGHKAGIIKAGCPVVFDGSNPDAAEVLFRTAKEQGATAYTYQAVPYEFQDGKLLVDLPYRGREYRFPVPFAAPYQAMNAALAVKAMEVSGLSADKGEAVSGFPADKGQAVSGLSVDGDQAVLGVSRAKWPARMEKIAEGVYLDGAHNEDGIRAFLDAACLLKERLKPENVRILFAVSSDKDYRGMLSEISRRLSPTECLLAKMSSHRALSLEVLKDAASEAFSKETRLSVYPEVETALKELFSAQKPGDLAFIAGSLYLAGDVKRIKAEECNDKF